MVETPRASLGEARPIWGQSLAATEVDHMVVLYSSQNYYVVEYPMQCGLEVIDRQTRRGVFLTGELASTIRVSMEHVLAENPSQESMDQFLGEFEGLLTQPVILH
ncbi:DUF3567 family protein [Pelomicrobium sp.]|jgi:hypothetical protein|uniref:DUF3567 family protein n=2 Tax=Pelomicrobium TaxID=2815315 RepID=UPI002FDE9EC7